MKKIRNNTTKPLAELVYNKAIREEIEWVISGTGNFDISLSVRDVDNYLHELNALIGQNFPDAYMAAFGHLGDNNIHISISFEEKDIKQKKLIEK